MYRRKRPNYTYSIDCGVPCFTFRIYLRKYMCTFTIIFNFRNPQTLQPYVKIGTMALSNNFN